MTIINEVLLTKYPEFNSRFKDLIRRILDKVAFTLFSIGAISNHT
jgi:hypothetical protein